MGLLFDRSPELWAKEKVASYSKRQKERARWRERRLEEGSRERSGKTLTHSFSDLLTDFEKLDGTGQYDASSGLWAELCDTYPEDLGDWLDANPTFEPAHGDHVGPVGSEPWRPMVACAKCGSHRWGSDHIK
jgi:hypothetical protein